MQIQKFVNITKPLWPLHMLLLLMPLVPLSAGPGALITGVSFLPVGALCWETSGQGPRGSPLHSPLPEAEPGPHCPEASPCSEDSPPSPHSALGVGHGRWERPGNDQS